MFRKLLFFSSLALIPVTAANASTISVNAQDVIFAAGNQSAVAAAASGFVPVSFAIPAGASYITFPSITGLLTMNIGTGNNSNNADGVGAAVASSSNSGSGSISGITAPNAGYLVGVFVGAGGPLGTAPASLNYSGGTSALSYSPLLDQTFFIGDGLTGNGTGSLQNFFIPVGATALYLGFSDACGYNGSPSCYYDNGGSLTVNYTLNNAASPVPEPSSLFLLGTGVAGAFGGLAFRRRRIA